MKRLIFSMAVLGALLASCSDNDTPTPEPINPVGEGTITGDINGTRVLSADTVYTLSGSVYVKPGATLRIEAGTRIEAEAGTLSDITFLAVERGATIEAIGTAAAPIVFTSDLKEAGAWGGLVICGNALTNKGANAQAEVAGLVYGGDNPEDNSGSLSHIIVEYAGALITTENEFNGITLYAVGSGTTFNNIHIYQCSDDGIEWFGGSVNGENLTVIGSQDDSFDWAEGWNGTVRNLYADQSVATAFSSDSRGIEADSDSGNPLLTPISNPTLSNVTLIGRNSAEVPSEAGVMLRRGTLGSITNLYLKDFISGAGVEVLGDESIAHFTANPVQGVRFDNVPNKGVASTFIEDENATGAGNGAERPEWSLWAEAFVAQ